MNVGIKCVLACFFSVGLLTVNAQSYCLEFMKEGKKSILIERNKKINYLLKNQDKLEKGVITRIAQDSILIETETGSKKVNQEESSYLIKSYSLQDFSLIAYSTTSRVVGGTALIIVASTVALLSSGEADIGADNSSPSGNIFQKNMDLEEGWSVRTVLCN